MKTPCVLLAVVLTVASAGCDGGSSGGDGDAAVGTPDVGAEVSADVADDVAVVDAASDTGGDVTGDTEADADAGPQVTEHPGCEGFEYTGTYLMPGPCEAGYDAELAAKARRIERTWRLLNAGNMGVNTDVTVAVANTADRELIAEFIETKDGWDFEDLAGKRATELITAQHKVAGLYAGMGIAADAFRYGVLRDQGYPLAEVVRAREHLKAGLEGFHRAATLPGTPGMVARGYNRKDLPGGDLPTTPLFDEAGKPLPEVKNNGTWREDLSGKYPGYVWEDSISRDMMLGWVTAAASAWEVIRDDEGFDPLLKQQLQADSLAIGRELMKVRESGYDLEIQDPDGRTTLHGWLNEHNLDGQVYAEFIQNGFHAVMALGFVAAWVYVTEDPELRTWLHDELIAARRLHELSRDEIYLIWLGVQSNYSAYNMAFGGVWLAQRYLDDPEVLGVLNEAVATSMYAIEGEKNQPDVLGQSYFDFIYSAGIAGQNPWGPLRGAPDEAAIERGLVTLRDYPEPPYWDFALNNCPDAVCDCDSTQVASSECTAADGSSMEVLGCIGRNCDLMVADPIPMKTRPPSNYHWRSNPFKPNAGGNGSTLLPSLDFRIAYWKARWVKRAD